MAASNPQLTTPSQVDFFTWNNPSISDVFSDMFSLSHLVNLILICVVFYFIIFPFFGPFLYAAVLYTNALIFSYYSYKESRESGYATLEASDRARNMVIKYTRFLSWLWHDYRVVGWDNIPDGPVIFVAYHGPITIDHTYFITSLWKRSLRPLYAVVHKKIATLSGLQELNHVFNISNYSQEECVEHLKDGGHVFLSPGGFEESKFSDTNYRVFLGNRSEFVQMALETNASLIPVFTRNIQEAFWIPFFVRPFVSGNYAIKKLPIYPISGGLPVKLTTYIGKPIDLDQDYTEEQLVEKVTSSLQDHIDNYQRIPGNRLYAILERWFANFRYKAKDQELYEITSSDEIQCPDSLPAGENGYVTNELTA